MCTRREGKIDGVKEIKKESKKEREREGEAGKK